MKIQVAQPDRELGSTIVHQTGNRRGFGLECLRKFHFLQVYNFESFRMKMITVLAMILIPLQRLVMLQYQR